MSRGRIHAAVLCVGSAASRTYPTWALYVLAVLPLCALHAVVWPLLASAWAAARAFVWTMADEHSGFPAFCSDVRYVLSLAGWRERRGAFKDGTA